MNPNTDRFEWLLNRLMAGTALESEKAELERLIREDDRKHLVYRACVEETHHDQQPVEAAFQRHWNLIHEREYAGHTPASVRRVHRRRMTWQVSAAAAILLVLGLFLWKVADRGNTSEFATEYGQRKRVELPDGSTVWLNGGSKLVYAEGFNVQNRKVAFRGEGYFDIKKDEDRPFVIDAGGATIKVLGTIFNLRAYEEEERVETSLIEGKVELTMASSPKAPILLTPGKKLSIYKNGDRMPDVPDKLQQIPLENSDVAVLTVAKTAEGETEVNDALWKNNKLVFDGDHLDIIASKLQKWYDVRVTLADTTLRGLKFSGVFEDMSLDAVLQTLEYTGSLRYQVSGNTVTFIPNESE